MTDQHPGASQRATSSATAWSALAVCCLLLACQPQVQGPSQTQVPDAGNASYDANTGHDAGSGVDSGSQGCNGACGSVQYNSCTCGSSDPCNWAGDGYCDTSRCQEVLSSGYFDDSADCGGTIDCGTDCSEGRYSACSCGATDPCGWAGDGYCDNGCEQLLPGAWFDDSADCGGGPSDCGSDCSNGRYNSCTCAGTDPCNWQRDGYCDETNCQQVLPGSHFDDADDCGGTTPPPTGDETFVVTMVMDDLDNNDGYIMHNGWDSMGYGDGLQDTNTTTSELLGYLNTEYTAMYHTGHGLDGEVVTADGSVMYYQPTINVHNTIFATCLTLSESWSSTFGATAETVLGYTEVSYDYTDDDVARSLLSYLQSSYNYIQAWYLANANIYSLADRWAGYVREGGSVVEYSARTNHKPAGVGTDMTAADVPLDGEQKLWAAPGLLQAGQTFTGPAVETGLGDRPQPAGRFVGAGWELLAPGELSPKQALAAAEQYVDDALGGLGQDAFLDRITPVTARNELQSGSVVAYSVRFGRRLHGLPVASNRVADHVTILVSPYGVAAWARYWPQVDLDAARASSPLLSSDQALRRGADEVRRALKQTVRLRSVHAGYGSSGAYGQRGALVPAWIYTAADGSQIVLDARSGAPLR